MKNLLLVIFVCVVMQSCTQRKPPINLETWQPPYHLDQPKGWGDERFTFPIEFATTIPYTGVEDLRFAPGWGLSENEDYWTYCFLWYLDGEVKFTEETLQENLKDYYNGLVGRNITKKKIAKEKVVETVTSFHKMETSAGDVQTFSGTISMLDYQPVIDQKPIVLNCQVHIKSCASSEMTYAFFELSPQPFESKTWQDLKAIETSFSCKGN